MPSNQRKKNPFLSYLLSKTSSPVRSLARHFLVWKPKEGLKTSRI